eukprot:TRINITY_DN32428_c0_g1_i1.p1 TRINITY_DN32428_c0_g1~~TRINITY_DN32428_c0_g1_i1.p1  ORF type:complete len:317 (+),score=62.16 TRINITY_DN32428_c0_g1_i1:115-951(+)
MHMRRMRSARDVENSGIRTPSSLDRTPSSLDKGLVEPTLTYGPLDNGESPEGLVMLLHGAGDSADGMMGLAEQWAPCMPRVAFLMPSAPVRGRHSSWFGRRKGSLQCVNYEVISKQLLALLETERRRLGLQPHQVALWGYSAGSLMASWLALQLPEPCAALVLLHGLAPDGRLPPVPPSARPRPPTLCLAGGRDAQIPPEAVEYAMRCLRALGFKDVTHRVEPEGGHGVSDDEIEIMGLFLKERLQTSTESFESVKAADDVRPSASLRCSSKSFVFDP